MTRNANKVNEAGSDQEPFNSSLTVVNLLDELDAVIGGYRKPTPQFLNSLNTFVEAYVLTDSIYISSRDAMHLNLAIPAFPDGRPILKMLTQDGILRFIVEGPDHLRDDTGTVIYAFEIPEGRTVQNDDEWFKKYCSDVERKYLSGLIPSYDIGTVPDRTPLLILGRAKGTQHYAVTMVDRNVSKCIQSVLSLSAGSRLHPALPLYAVKAQASFFAATTPSRSLYEKLAEIHNVKVEALLKYRGYRQIPIPPLASILLSRCKARTDIPTQMKQIRSEFQDLRDAGRAHERRLESASSLGEQLDAMAEFDEFWDVFSKKTKHQTTRLIYRMWDIVKEANPLKWFTKTVDLMVAWDQDQFILNRYKGLMDVWRLTRNIPSVQSQLRDVERVFGTTIAANEWKRYVAFADEVNRMMFPQGREGK
jgi:hypothetical protein